jgi:hypothetical protein
MSSSHSARGPDPPSRLDGLSIVLPCFDEVANVAAAVGAATTAARANADRYEIVVVDDGSSEARLRRRGPASPAAPVRAKGYATAAGAAAFSNARSP